MHSSAVNALFHRIAVTTMFIFVTAHMGSAQGGVTYSALRHGKWGVYYQSDLSAVPLQVRKAMAADQSSPVLAFDGSRVAYEVQGVGIYVCPVGSSDQCQVIRPKNGFVVRPTWHPSTREILYVNYTANGGQEDSEIVATGSGLEKSTLFIQQTGNQDYPDISPDGRFLAYTVASTISLRKNGMQVVQQLWLMDLGIGRARQLLMSNARDLQPDWSSSGQELAFASDRTGQYEIWFVRSDGTGLRQVTSGLGAKTWPAWSPDGRSIMFTRVKDGRHGLRIIGTDGSNDRPFKPFGSKSNIELRDADWQ